MRDLSRLIAALLTAGIVASFAVPPELFAGWPLTAAALLLARRGPTRHAANASILLLGTTAIVGLTAVGIRIRGIGVARLPQLDDVGLIALFASVFLPATLYLMRTSNPRWARWAKTALSLHLAWSITHGTILATEAIRNTHITFEAHTLLLIAGGLITIALLVARTIRATPRNAPHGAGHAEVETGSGE